MKNLTNERLLDIANQLNAITKELTDSCEHRNPGKKQNIRAMRIAECINKLNKKS